MCFKLSRRLQALSVLVSPTCLKAWPAPTRSTPTGATSQDPSTSRAHPLACGYPAAPPQVGDYLTVADTVPTPAPGLGVYYITSATYQGATRFGRKSTAGRLSGRDPAVLPACDAATAVVSGRPQR